MSDDLTQLPSAVSPLLRRPRGVCKCCGTPCSRWLCPTCEEGVAEAKREEEQRRRIERAQELLRHLGAVHDPGLLVQPEIVSDEWSREAINWARRWSPHGPGAWMHGGVGSGKSTIIGRLGRRLADQGYSVAACSLQRMVSTLTYMHLSRSSDRASYHQALRALGSVDVLLLDDVLAHTPNRGELDELLAVLDARWNARSSCGQIIATANFDRGPGILKAQAEWSANDPEQPPRIMSRLMALTGHSVRCWYPGDRRIPGSYDEVLAARLRKLIQAEDEKANDLSGEDD